MLGANARWCGVSTGHVGTLELEVAGLRLELEVYRGPCDELLWLWRDASTKRVCYRSICAEEAC